MSYEKEENKLFKALALAGDLNSILLAAKTLCEGGRGHEHILTEDISQAMKTVFDENRGGQFSGSDRMAEMLGCIRSFCEGLAGNYADFIAISKQQKSLYCPV